MPPFESLVCAMIARKIHFAISGENRGNIKKTILPHKKRKNYSIGDTQEMEHLNIGMLLFLIASGFLASFIDSVVGGGGLISIPALMMTGLPPTVVLGTNKLAGTISSLTSTITYIRSGKINFRLVKYLLPLSFAGSILGVYTVKQISSDFLRPLIIVFLILVTFYSLLKKEWGRESKFEQFTVKTGIFIAMASFAIGFYDGFFGGGTGSFLMFSFLLLGFDFIQAAAKARLLNFTSNIAALIFFICLHDVNFVYGIPMGTAMLLGALVGSNVALRKGASYVKVLFVSVTILLIGKQIIDYL
jgi:uncharacterized protein